MLASDGSVMLCLQWHQCRAGLRVDKRVGSSHAKSSSREHGRCTAENEHIHKHKALCQQSQQQHMSEVIGPPNQNQTGWLGHA
jgi:hypothetical protein